MGYRDDHDWPPEPKGSGRPIARRCQQAAGSFILSAHMGAAWLGDRLRSLPGFIKEVAVVIALVFVAMREVGAQHPATTPGKGGSG